MIMSDFGKVVNYVELNGSVGARCARGGTRSSNQ